MKESLLDHQKESILMFGWRSIIEIFLIQLLNWNVIKFYQNKSLSEARVGNFNLFICFFWNLNLTLDNVSIITIALFREYLLTVIYVVHKVCLPRDVNYQTKSWSQTLFGTSYVQPLNKSIEILIPKVNVYKSNIVHTYYLKYNIRLLAVQN